MSSKDKTLAILNLFCDAKIEISHDDVATALACSRATAYRYLKALTDAGVVVSTRNGTYAPGPKVIELERLVRRSDPLPRAARPVMETLSRGLRVAVMLCGYYGDRVLCTEAIGTGSVGLADYDRGRPLPRFSGAQAKVILANVSSGQLQALMLNHADEIRAAGLGDDWDTFRARMQKIRRKGSWVTHSEVVSGFTGVAAPIFSSDGRVLGSIALVVDAESLARTRESVLRLHIVEAARAITAGLQTQT